MNKRVSCECHEETRVNTQYHFITSVTKATTPHLNRSEKILIFFRNLKFVQMAHMIASELHHK